MKSEEKHLPSVVVLQCWELEETLQPGRLPGRILHGVVPTDHHLGVQQLLQAGGDGVLKPTLSLSAFRAELARYVYLLGFLESAEYVPHREPSLGQVRQHQTKDGHHFLQDRRVAGVSSDVGSSDSKNKNTSLL